MISRVFPCKILHIHITSVSGCLSFTFKICQNVAGTRMIRQFLIFGGILLLGSTVPHSHPPCSLHLLKLSKTAASAGAAAPPQPPLRARASCSSSASSVSASKTQGISRDCDTSTKPAVLIRAAVPFRKSYCKWTMLN